MIDIDTENCRPVCDWLMWCVQWSDGCGGREELSWQR